MKTEFGVNMKTQTPLKAIRAKCLDCSVYQLKEVRDCQITDCTLHPFRLGKNPNRKRVGNVLAFSKKTGVESAFSLTAPVTDINASAAAANLNSSTQLNGKEE